MRMHNGEDLDLFRLGSDGRIDLLNPDPNVIDLLTDIIKPLARYGRYACQPQRDPPYSVIEHSTLGAAFAMAETGDPRKALKFLTHDLHEAVIGDLVTPIVVAMVETHGPVVREAVKALKDRLDICLAKRMDLPRWTTEEDEYSHDMDWRMLLAERKALWAKKDIYEPTTANRIRKSLSHHFYPIRFLRACGPTIGPFDINLSLWIPWDECHAVAVWMSAYYELKKEIGL